VANQNLADIDPAMTLMGKFAKLTGGSTAAMHKVRRATLYSDGDVPSKYKVLAAALWSVSSRCEPCIKYYVNESIKLGATEKEFAEFMAVATGMGGCVGETWAMKAFKAFVDIKNGVESETDAADSCGCG
jgi:alkylhydroperoxidase/carboxymuconolactone decarboxylase family protein YurZ